MQTDTGRIKIAYLLGMAVAIWLLEAFVHAILFGTDTFWNALIFDVSVHESYMRLIIMISACMLYLLLLKTKTIKEKETQIENILNNVIPICITDTDYRIVMANDSYWSIWGRPKGNKQIRCFEHRPGETCRTDECALQRIMNGEHEYIAETKKESHNQTRYFILTARPFLDGDNKVRGIIESFQDITERKRLEDEKGVLINELQGSLNKVKLLSGFLPICASCKKIRDDQGYWKQIESYIRDHSEAEFSHGICPDCARKLYPDFTPDPDTPPADSTLP